MRWLPTMPLWCLMWYHGEALLRYLHWSLIVLVLQMPAGHIGHKQCPEITFYSINLMVWTLHVVRCMTENFG